MEWPFILALSITHIIAVVLMIFVYPFRKSDYNSSASNLTLFIVISIVTLVVFAAEIGFIFVHGTGFIYWLLLYWDGLCFGFPFWIVVASFIGISYIKKKNIGRIIASYFDVCLEAVGAIVVAVLYAILQHFIGKCEVIFFVIFEAAYIALIIAVIVRMCQGYPIYLPGGKVVCKVKNSGEDNPHDQQSYALPDTSSVPMIDLGTVQIDFVQSESDSVLLDDESSLQQDFTQTEASADSFDDQAKMRTVVVCFQTKLIQIVEKITICVDGGSVAEVTNDQPTPLLVTSYENHKIEVFPFRFYSSSKAVDIPHGMDTIYYLVTANADLSVSIIEIDGHGNFSGFSECK
ncbi:MAG: hypothetical protein LUD51_03810 [Clostridia bacterium]|nr:hypothetical protein [Clostridia bacterium]